MAEYLFYFRPDSYDASGLADYAASEQFKKLAQGDTLFIATYLDKSLYLIGRLQVDQVVGRRDAESILGRSNLWSATWYAIAEPGTAEPFAAIEIEQLARRLRFDGRPERLPGNFTAQSLQSMRRLKPASAALLRGRWEALGPGGGLIPQFSVGAVYRRQVLHDRFGGQTQGGISTPRKYPMVMLFTGESGARYGYQDGEQPDGSFWYTGEGQVGDMKMVRGNRAILEHLYNDKDLHVFEDVGAGEVRYRGRAQYLEHHWDEAPDRNGDLRKAIVFELAMDVPLARVPLDEVIPEELSGTQGLLRTPSKRDGKKTPGGGRRRTGQAKVIGDQAEKIVAEWLRRILPKQCRASVVWRAQRGEQPGWDIDYRDASGTEQMVEVKGTKTAYFASIEITENEWAAARDYRQQYWLFLVSSCMSRSPKIEKLRDPYGQVEKGALAATPAAWRVERA
jgi:hypothetical protein